jgi:glycosyltransferase involved in cell wall biosynthesis
MARNATRGSADVARRVSKVTTAPCPLSIGMITMGYGRSQAGGAEHQAALLATELARRGCAITLYAPMPTSDATESPGFRVRRVPALGVPKARTATYIVALASLLLSTRHLHDVLHTHMVWYHALPPQLARRLRSTRTIIKFAGSGPGAEVDTLSRTWHGRILLQQAITADRLIALNSAIADELLAIGVDRDRIRVLPNGVRLHDHGRPAKDLDDPAPTALFAGRLDMHKGIDRLVGSWGQVAERVPGARLLVAGTGPLEEDLRRAGVVARGSIRVLGHRTDMPSVYAAADLLVLPSRSEGMSNVVLQALAAAKPVVAFDVAGVAELVGPDAGWTAKPGDWPGLLELVANGLAARDEAASRGVAGRRRVEREYDIATVTERYLELYDELA